VAEIARLHGMNANLIFAWKKALTPRSVVSSNAFIPVEIRPPLAPASDTAVARASPSQQEASGTIEIVLPCGTRLRCDATIDERTLRRVLMMLKALT
jgi:transposase-like protein